MHRIDPGHRPAEEPPVGVAEHAVGGGIQIECGDRGPLGCEVPAAPGPATGPGRPKVVVDDPFASAVAGEPPVPGLVDGGAPDREDQRFERARGDVHRTVRRADARPLRQVRLEHVEELVDVRGRDAQRWTVEQPGQVGMRGLVEAHQGQRPVGRGHRGAMGGPADQRAPSTVPFDAALVQGDERGQGHVPVGVGTQIDGQARRFVGELDPAGSTVTVDQGHADLAGPLEVEPHLRSEVGERGRTGGTGGVDVPAARGHRADHRGVRRVQLRMDAVAVAGEVPPVRPGLDPSVAFAHAQRADRRRRADVGPGAMRSGHVEGHLQREGEARRDGGFGVDDAGQRASPVGEFGDRLVVRGAGGEDRRHRVLACPAKWARAVVVDPHARCPHLPFDPHQVGVATRSGDHGLEESGLVADEPHPVFGGVLSAPGHRAAVEEAIEHLVGHDVDRGFSHATPHGTGS